MSSCLAFDTATEHLSIALQVHGRVWSHEGPGGAQASTTLIPAIFDLLAQAGIGLRDLDAIAFGRGPGAFTGLRTACSVAQGLAFGADLPVLPIDTLLAVADDARQTRGAPAHDDGWVAMDARMGEIYAAHAVFGAEGWQLPTPPLLCTPQALQERWAAQPPVVVAGTATVTLDQQVLTLAVGEHVDIAVGQVHRLANFSTEPVEIVEVQLGAYLEEDDIVRLCDYYGRA